MALDPTSDDLDAIRTRLARFEVTYAELLKLTERQAAHENWCRSHTREDLESRIAAQDAEIASLKTELEKVKEGVRMVYAKLKEKPGLG